MVSVVWLLQESRNIFKYGIPQRAPDVSLYKGHALCYDQQKRVPHWVAEHITKNQLTGSADIHYYDVMSVGSVCMSVHLHFTDPSKTIHWLQSPILASLLSNIHTRNDVTSCFRLPANWFNVGIFKLQLRSSCSTDLRNVQFCKTNFVYFNSSITRYQWL